MRVLVVVGTIPQDTNWMMRLPAHVDVMLAASAYPWSPTGLTYEPIPPEGVSTVMLDPVIRGTRGHLWWIYRGLKSVVSKFRPEVVHVVSEPWGMLLTQSLWLGSESAVTAHGAEIQWGHGHVLERRLRLLAARRNLQLLSGFAGENSRAVELAQIHGLPAGAPSIQAHSNPRDDDLFRPPTALERSRARDSFGMPDSPVIGYLGRLVPEKGALDLVEAWRRLPATNGEVCLALAGDGPLGSMIDELTSPGRPLRFGTLRYPDEVRRFLWACDALVVPSYQGPNTLEQGSRAAAEALLTGLPLVVSDSGGLPETVGEAGLVFHERGITDLTEALVRVLDPTVADQLRSRARQRGLAKFSSQAAAGEFVDLWTQALEFKRSG